MGKTSRLLFIALFYAQREKVNRRSKRGNDIDPKNESQKSQKRPRRSQGKRFFPATFVNFQNRLNFKLLS